MWLCPVCRAPASFPDARRPWPPGWSCQACGHALTVRDGIPWLAPELAHAAEGYDPVLFETLASIEETNFWFTNRANLIAFLIRKYFPDAKRFLEIGCGTGSVLRVHYGKNCLAFISPAANCWPAASNLRRAGLAPAFC